MSSSNWSADRREQEYAMHLNLGTVAIRSAFAVKCHRTLPILV